jgi:hypothetical protein
MATTVTDPPSHMGVPAQYSSEVRAPAKRPKAIRTHTEAPPSSGMAAPSSALARPRG